MRARCVTFKLVPALVAGFLLILTGCARPADFPTDKASDPASAADEIPNRHDRPIVDRDGRTLLWAGEDDEGNVAWFDMTGSTIDPRRFQYGIGKDTIASIDDPEFASFGDPRLAERGITRATRVLGVEVDGIARAYPVDVMTIHEVVNDEFDGEAYAVLW